MHCVGCHGGSNWRSGAGRGRCTTSNRRRRACCCRSRRHRGRLGASDGGLEEGATGDATSGLGHCRLAWRASSTTTAAALLLLLLLLRLLLPQKLWQKLLDQLLEELLLRLASSPTTAATLLLLPWLLSLLLLLLLRASRNRSMTVITKARRWHSGRRTVMLVEPVDRFVQ